MAAESPTHLAFLHDGKLLTHQTTVQSIRPWSELEEANRELFKVAEEDTSLVFAVVTKETIFHPQGGGQPSDLGAMTAGGAEAEMLAARMDTVRRGQVLHLCRPAKGQEDAAAVTAAFQPGATVQQHVDADKRLLFSRLHTAGHVLGAAVRTLVQDEIEGFDELKASHFPGNSSCEFQGLIEGKWKAPFQEQVNKYVEGALPVTIDFWKEEDFQRQGLMRLIREMPVPDGGVYRVVRIDGTEVYPCGGTHVDTTDLCGATTVKKISRSKGLSKVSYSVE